MTASLVQAWEQYKSILKAYGGADALLNPPCSAQQVGEVETRLSFALPLSLRALLTLNNGQRLDEQGMAKGIFKSVSGWDVYQRQVYLGIQEIEAAYKAFVDDNVLIAEFGAGQIPFAVAGSPTHYTEAFCIDFSTETVNLIWTQHVDPFNPPEWQVHKFRRAESLTEFVQRQIELYQ
jgi:hypothetical protein